MCTIPHTFFSLFIRMCRNMTRQLFILFGWLCASSFSLAQWNEPFASRYSITGVTMEEGLRNNFIDDICKDDRGFIWIGTAGGGLSRFDGYEFLHFDINSHLPVKSNFIRKIEQDRWGRLWIATEGGIDIWDLTRWAEAPGFAHDALLQELCRLPANWVYADSRGNMWLSVANKLARIVFDSQGGLALVEVQEIHKVLNSFSACTEFGDELWVGCRHEIYAYSMNGKEKLAGRKTGVLPGLAPDTYLAALYKKGDELWVGTDHGLFRVYLETHAVKTYLHNPADALSLSQNYVTDIVETSGGVLLVSNLMGINVYDSVRDGFEHIYQSERPGHNGLNCNFVNCMLNDGDLIWVGTEVGGINKLAARKISVLNYSHSQNEQQSLSPNPVNAIQEDAWGDLWVGTVEGGLNRKPRHGAHFEHYTTSPPARLSHNSVSALAIDADQRLWVGTWGGAITLMNLKLPHKPVVDYVNATTHPGYLGDFVGTLQYDPINNGVWIGTSRDILFYDIASKSIEKPFPAGVTEKLAGCIGSAIDRKGKLWMGTSIGLFIVDLHSYRNNDFRYVQLTYDVENPDTRILEKISFIYQAGNGDIWLGSNGYGLSRVVQDGTRYAFDNYNTSNVLSDNSVRGITEDNNGYLWLATNNGLACFDVRAQRLRNYTTHHGLLSNQFYWNAAFSSKTSPYLFFGSLHGLVAVNPNVLAQAADTNKVVLTRLTVLNQEVIPGTGFLNEDISEAQHMRIHERNKSFSIEFSALNYETPQAVRYSYRMKGFDDNWVEVASNRRFASYTNLPPGDYLFEVRQTTEQGDWSAPATLHIEVIPFFYKTLWFFALCVVLLGVLGWQLVHWRVHSLKAQRKLLHTLVRQRTEELLEQKQLLEEKTMKLSHQNRLLKHKNIKITRQKERLILLSKKIQKLTLDKLAFFTNVSHEFRTPVTLIAGPIERALKLSSNPQVIEQLQIVERNSKYLLSLINQLMDFRKVESDNLEVRKKPGDFVRFVRQLVVPFEAFASERGILVEKHFRMSRPDLMFDEDAMQKVLTNLLSNAIKFTPNQGKVSLSVALLYHKAHQQHQLLISVKDSGAGIPEADLKKIFHRFYQSNNQVKYPVYGQSGTGIGLYLCKRIVELHGGIIYAKNNPGHGCVFRILMPVELPGAESFEVVAEHEAPPAQPVRVMKKPHQLTVLVVEDNTDMRQFIRAILTSDYNVLEAAHGEEALAVLSFHSVDFIICDLMMPVMDGLELARQLKQNFAISHIPILMLTAKQSEEARTESYKVGVDAYLFKPFSEKMLLARIEGILGNRKSIQGQFSVSMNVDVLNIDEESSDKKFLNKALLLVKENYQNPDYEVADFVEQMGVSKTLLNKKMQSLTGQPAGKFIRNYRLSIAREMLLINRETRNMNISEIAYEVGFNDPKYFTRCFTRHFNVTPSSMLDVAEEADPGL